MCEEFKSHGELAKNNPKGLETLSTPTNWANNPGFFGSSPSQALVSGSPANSPAYRGGTVVGRPQTSTVAPINKPMSSGPRVGMTMRPADAGYGTGGHGGDVGIFGVTSGYNG